jgi:hypothetical protein
MHNTVNDSSGSTKKAADLSQLLFGESNQASKRRRRMVVNSDSEDEESQ